MKLSEVLDKVEEIKQVGSGWSGRCPAHDDKTASLSISVGENNRLLLHCHAGCSFFEVTAALQVEPADLAVIEVDEVGVTTVSAAGPQPPTDFMLEGLADYCRRASELFPVAKQRTTPIGASV